MGRGQWAPPLEAVIALVGTLLPFAYGSDLLERISGVRVPAASVRRVAQAAGREVAALEAATADRIARELPPAVPGPPRQLLSGDGVMVPLVGGDWREVKLAVFGTLGTTAGGEPTAKELSYVAAVAEVSTFSHALLGEAHRRGLERAEVVAAVSDGVVWCQQVIDDHAPHAIRVLDFPHAMEHLNAAATAVFGPATKQAQAWLERQVAELRDGSPDAVLAAVAALPVAEAPDPVVAATTRDRVAAYLGHRRRQIAYADFRARQLPIGSGAVESGNKLVVEARLKGAGMHWAPVNLAAMLALRCGYCSQRWEESWTTLRAHRRQTRPWATRAPAPSAPVAVSPPPVAPAVSLVPAPARPKTIVNGRPTADHPWKRRLPLRDRPPGILTPNI